MPVMIGVAGKGNVVLGLQTDQALHGVRRRGIQADLAVPVHSHESELRIDVLADNGQVDLVTLRNSTPIVHTGTTERIDAHVNACAAHDIEIDHVAQIADVSVEIIKLLDVRGTARLSERQPLYVPDATLQQYVGTILYPACDIGVGRPTIGRVVFEAPVIRRVV